MDYAPLVASSTSEKDAVPVGEGWTRHNQELLVHPPSQVFFAQRGERRGRYLVRGDDKKFSVCPAPHVGADYPIEVRAAGASVLRPQGTAAPAPNGADASHCTTPPAQGGSSRSDADRKNERAVVIADMPKTARLALRFPLGFLDSPAACYALMSGLRGSSAAAHWCASQFHQRLLPEIAKRIHGWWDSEAEMPEELLYRGSHVGSLASLLREHLQGLDRDLLAGPHGFAGCDVVIAVLVGESLVAAAVGQASATLLFDDIDPIPLVAAPDTSGEQSENGSAPAVGQLKPGVASEGALRDSNGLLRRAKSAWDAQEASAASSTETKDVVGRILRAPDAFAVLGFSTNAPEGGTSEVRSAYKRLALRVHPDKVRDCDPNDAKAAFERVESATRVIESLAEQDSKACWELHRMLRFDPFTARGAAALLQVETDALEHHVDKAVQSCKDSIAKVQPVREADAEVRRALEHCQIAAETLRIARQSSAPGTAGERLLAEGVRRENLGALGLRDLRGLACGGVAASKAAVEVRTASWRVGEALRVALCAGATAEMKIEDLEGVARLCQWQPKAAALQWSSAALALPTRQNDTSASAICICLRDRMEEDTAEVDGPAAKRQKVAHGPRSVRVRHLLLRCAEPGKPLPDDPMARRPKTGASARRSAKAAAADNATAPLATVRTPAEAEAELVELLRELLPSSGQPEDSDVKQRLDAFRKLCQQKSECDSADNAGQLCGDIGWVSRGQVEPAFEQAAFTLRVGEISDVVTTSRGVHLIQRLA